MPPLTWFITIFNQPIVTIEIIITENIMVINDPFIL